MVNNYTKVTSRRRYLTGAEKVAILLGELGIYTSENVMSCIRFSKRDLHRIRTAMQSLGTYNPLDVNQVNTELDVLQEVYAFGQARGILPEVEQPNVRIDEETVLEKTSAIRNMVGRDPNSIARALNSYLDDDDDDDF